MIVTEKSAVPASRAQTQQKEILRKLLNADFGDERFLEIRYPEADEGHPETGRSDG